MDASRCLPSLLSALLLLFWSSAGCKSTSSPLFGTEPEATTSDTLLALTEAYNDAWEQLSADAILSFHGSGFQYYWFDQRLSAEFEEVLRHEWLPGIEAYSIEMVDPQVYVLATDAAVVSFQFLDREWADGSVEESKGALGYIFERQNGAWKIVRIHHSGPVPERYLRP